MRDIRELAGLCAGAALLAVGVGCEEGACDQSAASSVTVSVWDQEGDPAVPDAVTYAVDGGASAPCEPLSTDNEFVCGWEETGSFLIQVMKGSAVYQEELEVELRADGCHVDSRFVDIEVW